MGIDDVHRAFRPKAPIRLECQKCEQPKPDVSRRYGVWFTSIDMAIVCDACAVAVRSDWLNRELVSHGYKG